MKHDAHSHPRPSVVTDRPVRVVPPYLPAAGTPAALPVRQYLRLPEPL